MSTGKAASRKSAPALLGQLMSVEEAAKRLGGISVWTVRAWIQQGRIEKTKVGDRVMVTSSALERFLESCRG
jgi:excisionase family DNA binding protein